MVINHLKALPLSINDHVIMKKMKEPIFSFSSQKLFCFAFRMPPIRNERSRWRQSNSEARSQMSSPQSVPFFLPFYNSPWGLDRGDTISKFLDLIHPTP